MARLALLYKAWLTDYSNPVYVLHHIYILFLTLCVSVSTGFNSVHAKARKINIIIY